MKGRWESNINVFSEIKLLFPKQNYNVLSLSSYMHAYICARFIYFQDLSAYSAEGKYVDWSWEYINRSKTHECGNWDRGRAIPRKGIHKWDFPCSAPEGDGPAHGVLNSRVQNKNCEGWTQWCVCVWFNVQILPPPPRQGKPIIWTRAGRTEKIDPNHRIGCMESGKLGSLSSSRDQKAAWRNSWNDL